MYQQRSAPDQAVFNNLLARDPESRLCFECGATSAPWCDVHHGTFLCIDCCGSHARDCGVHVVFMRHRQMDVWSDRELRQMQCGGNGRARRFFAEQGGFVLDKSISMPKRYESKAALMYKSLIETEAKGEFFDADAWRPPEWWHKQQILIKKNQQKGTQFE